MLILGLARENDMQQSRLSITFANYLSRQRKLFVQAWAIELKPSATKFFLSMISYTFIWADYTFLSR